MATPPSARSPGSAPRTTSGSCSGVSGGTVLLEDDPGHVRVELDRCRRAVLAGPAQRRPKGCLENVVPVVVGGDCLAAGDKVEVGQPSKTHRAPHQDLRGVLDSLRWGDL